MEEKKKAKKAKKCLHISVKYKFWKKEREIIKVRKERKIKGKEIIKKKKRKI